MTEVESGESKQDPAPAEPSDESKRASEDSGEPAPTPVEHVATIERASGRLHNDLLALDVTNIDGLLQRVELRSKQFADADGDGLSLLGNREPTLSIAVARDDEDDGFRIPRDAAWEVRETEDAREWALTHRGEDIEAQATLTLGDAYEGVLKVKIINRSSKAQKHRLVLRTDFALPDEDSRYNIHRGMCLKGEDVEDFTRDDVEEGPQRVRGGVRWMALDSSYFVAALIPTQTAQLCEIRANDDVSALVGTLGFKTEKLEPNEARTYELGLYLGTKEIERLENYATVSGVQLEKSIDWGWFGVLNRTLGKLMLRLLRWFFSLTGVWGVSILLLTVVVKAVTLPLTLKQMNSMKRMKEIQPQIEELRKKYEDDRVRQGQEMQALFQRSGVNPLAGCLPLVIQMPIWIALYAMLGTVVELYREPFLWLPDLTQPDPFFILPVAMGALMFFQTRLQPSMDSQQAKMMGIMMPGIFTVMMLFLPSGLGVYIFANVVLSLIQTVIQVRPNKKAAAKS